MKKPFKGLMLLLCLGAIVSSLSAKEVIKVGVVTPLSGDFAVLKELADVMRLRAEELGKNAESKYTYEYIFEDSRFDPKTSHLAATKLLKVDKVEVPLGSPSKQSPNPKGQCKRLSLKSVRTDFMRDRSRMQLKQTPTWKTPTLNRKLRP